MDFELKWRIGIRTSVMLWELAQQFQSSISIRHKDLLGNAKECLELMLVCSSPEEGKTGAPRDYGLRAGERISLIIDGPDAAAAMLMFIFLFTSGPRQDKCPVTGCPSLPILVPGFWNGAFSFACSNGHYWDPQWPRKI